MATTWVVAKRRGYGADLPRMPQARELGRSFMESIWALAFPVILIVGFRFGLFTATEAGVGQSTLPASGYC